MTPECSTRDQAMKWAVRSKYPSLFTKQQSNGLWRAYKTDRQTVEAAELWAEDYDWVFWVEEDEDGLLKAIVTLPEKECLALCELPTWLTLDPITPSLWQNDLGFAGQTKTGRISSGSPAQSYTRPKDGTTTARVWAIADGIGDDRTVIIESCVEEGINPATAKTQYAKWKKTLLYNESA